MLIRKKTFFFICLSFALLSGMASGQQRFPYIINGLETSDFPAVGIVGEQSVGGFCTGTLISPSHVLTAAHCAAALLDYGTADSGTFEVNGRVYRTVSVEIIPSYDDQRFSNDVAILVLSEPVEGVEPATLSSTPPSVGEIVTMVGFGGAGTPQEGSDGSFGVKRVGLSTVDDVDETEFSWLFDDPAESNPAPGDSGGPIFVGSAGNYQIAGIVSSGTRADAGLGDTNFNARVDAYEAWISETVVATQAILDGSEEPVEEEPVEEEPVEEEPVEEEPVEEEPVEEEPVEEVDAATDCTRRPAGKRPGRRRPGRQGNRKDDCNSTAKPTCLSDQDAIAVTTEADAATQVAAVSSTQTANASSRKLGGRYRRRTSHRSQLMNGARALAYFSVDNSFPFSRVPWVGRDKINQGDHPEWEIAIPCWGGLSSFRNVVIRSG